MSEVDPFIGYGSVKDGATSRHAQYALACAAEGAGFPVRSVGAARVDSVGGAVA